jgi:DNA-binding HxlR family transcriptional regulator
MLREERSHYDSRVCSAQRALEIVGDKWSVLILREAFLGTQRFTDFQRALGCAKNILSARLARLVEHDVLELRTYQENGERARDGYHLTAKGRDLFPVVVALMDWGDRYLSPDGAPLHVKHKACRGRVHATIVCSKGHAAVDPRDVYVSPGPGAQRIA